MAPDETPSDEEWEKMSVNDRLQAAKKNVDEGLRRLQPESMPPDDAAELADEMRRMGEKVERYNRAYEKQQRDQSNH
jgi:hypothetical protein